MLKDLVEKYEIKKRIVEKIGFIYKNSWKNVKSEKFGVYLQIFNQVWQKGKHLNS